MTSRKTGTREWSDHSINCRLGCTNGCLYCYARERALRFRQIARGEDWTDEREGPAPKIRRYRGRVMFPTRHDLTPANWEATYPVLCGLLAAGNEVLLVTKADREVIRALGKAMLDSGGPLARAIQEHRLEVRVTMGASSDRILEFWEPGAPRAISRLWALGLLWEWGVPTSISVEPLLDADYVRSLVATGAPHTKGEIWIGAANRLRARTAWCRGLEGLEEEIRRVEAGQTPEAMARVYEALRGYPQVRWKDSYQRALGIDALGREAE